MLTHLHMVVYTWWCWHICKGGGVPRVERGVGSSLPASLVSGVVLGVLECTGRTGVSPVLSVRCASGLANLSAHESGEHRTLRMRPVASIR